MPSVGSTPTTSTSPALQQQQLHAAHPPPPPPANPPAHTNKTQQSNNNNATCNTTTKTSNTSTATIANNNASMNNNNNQQYSARKTKKKSSSTSSSTSTNSSMTAHNGTVQPQQQSKPHVKLKQQHSLPLQLQYHHYQPQVTTTQPSPAGTFINQAGIISSTTAKKSNGTSLNNGGDITPLSTRSNSFSSVDTNQTLLNSIANQHYQHLQQQQQQQQQQPQSQQQHRHASTGSGYRTKYGQFMIITPAVSIDRDFEYETAGGVFDDDYNDTGTFNADADNNDDDDDPYFGRNSNIFRMAMRQGSIDSGHSTDSSLHSNYNSYLHTSRQHLLPKNSPTNFYAFSSWRWCTFICAAMRCFGAGHNNSHGTYSTSFVRRHQQRPFYRTNSTGIHYTNSSMPHHRLRSSSFTAETAFEHFSAPFKPRKTRDHMNNITYEL